MRSTLRVPLIALAGVAIAAAPAFAAEPGWYTGLRGGIVEAEQMRSLDPATSNLTINPNTGWTILGSLGYRFSSPFRLELQGGYQHSNIRGTFQENATAPGLCGTTRPCLGPTVNGDISGPSMFGMVYYDMPVTERMTLSLGGGVGAQRIGLNAHTIGTQGGTANRFNLVDAEDTVFAGRGSAELAYNIGRADLTLGYTYTRTAGASLAGTGAVAPFTFKDNMSSHGVSAGVRLGF